MGMPPDDRTRFFEELPATVNPAAVGSAFSPED